MIHHTMWLVTAASIVGTIANVHKRRWCFHVWAVTNTVWCIYDVCLGAHAQAGLQAVYVALSIWGIARWREARVADAHTSEVKA